MKTLRLTQAEYDKARQRIGKAVRLPVHQLATKKPVVKRLGRLGTVSEELLSRQLAEAGIKATREVRFHPQRRWRFDFAIEGSKLAVEIDGGQWATGGGRHAGDADREKMAEAAILGYRIIRASPAQVRSGLALEWIRRALDG